MQITADILKDFRHNFSVNVADGAFFGFGMGLTSTVAVLPLFLATLTDSTTLIGLIASIHLIGWQLPQLFMAKRVTRRRRYIPMVLWLTIQERWPFFGLAVVALLTPSMPPLVAVLLVYLFYGWHSVGAGITAPAWQSMIGKIMPVRWRGTFYGTQSGAFSLLGALGALIAGWMIANVAYPVNFAIIFALAGVMMVISWVFLAMTREPEHDALPVETAHTSMWRHIRGILSTDANFRWFLVARSVMQFTLIGMNFYTLYALRIFELGPETIGLLTSVLLIAQTISNPIVGWVGDRIGHRLMLVFGAAAFFAANTLAITTTDPNLLYVVFALAGVGNTVFFTSMLTLTLNFGQDHNRAYYIGLGNTLIAPISLVTPLLGGILVDVFGFGAMFGLTIAAAVIAGLILLFLLRDQHENRAPQGRSGEPAPAVPEI
jgi:MFS family permease